jgi:two-component system chemotaxis response regulator CheB
MTNRNLVIIGVSTGGPLTLKALFRHLPPIDAAIVIVLHIKAGMDAMIVRGLATSTSMPVTLAGQGEFLRDGHVYLAPGGCHLTLEGNHRVVLTPGERVNFVQPSADLAMMSLHKQAAGKIVGVVLTGMGKDGAEGIRHIKSVGGTTIAQDQASSAIYGMPKAAVLTGAVDFVLPPERIAEKIAGLLARTA